MTTRRMSGSSFHVPGCSFGAVRAQDFGAVWPSPFHRQLYLLGSEQYVLSGPGSDLSRRRSICHVGPLESLRDKRGQLTGTSSEECERGK